MALSAADVKVGDSRTELVFDNITRTQIVQYAGASGDYNPLHSDELFTTKIAGYPSVFAHGMLTMGMTGRLVTDLVGAANVTSFGGRFTSQVFPGDTLTGKLVVDSVDGGVARMTVTTTNQHGVVVFSGQATGSIG